MIENLIFTLFFIIAIISSVFFAGAEEIYGSVSRESVEKLMENGVRGASHLYIVIRNRRRFHITLLIGRVISIALGSILLYNMFGIGGIENGYTRIVTGAFTIIISSVIFIFTEGVLGKLISLGEHDSNLGQFAYLLVFFNKLFFPLSFIIDNILSLFIKKDMELAAKEEALKELLQSESEEGVLEKEESEMIHDIFEFFDTTVKEIMIPRIDIVAVEKSISLKELIDLFRKEGHSRMPVYDERIDNIMGVIYAKDILPVISEGGHERFSVSDIMRKAYYVPETKRISVLLKEFKKSKVHIAIVVDEYGGTAGIVALEDLLEEIVGEIQDEYDEDVKDYLWINEQNVIIDAGIDIYAVNEILRAELPSEDFDTLAGFMYHQLGVVPKGGEEFRWNNFTFVVREIKGTRISKVMVRIEESANNSTDKEMKTG